MNPGAVSGAEVSLSVFLSLIHALTMTDVTIDLFPARK